MAEDVLAAAALVRRPVVRGRGLYNLGAEVCAERVREACID